MRKNKKTKNKGIDSSVRGVSSPLVSLQKQLLSSSDWLEKERICFSILSKQRISASFEKSLFDVSEFDGRLLRACRIVKNTPLESNVFDRNLLANYANEDFLALLVSDYEETFYIIKDFFAPLLKTHDLNDFVDKRFEKKFSRLTFMLASIIDMNEFSGDSFSLILKALEEIKNEEDSIFHEISVFLADKIVDRIDFNLFSSLSFNKMNLLDTYYNSNSSYRDEIVGRSNVEEIMDSKVFDFSLEDKLCLIAYCFSWLQDVHCLMGEEEKNEVAFNFLKQFLDYKFVSLRKEKFPDAYFSREWSFEAVFKTKDSFDEKTVSLNPDIKNKTFNVCYSLGSNEYFDNFKNLQLALNKFNEICLNLNKKNFFNVMIGDKNVETSSILYHHYTFKEIDEITVDEYFWRLP